MGQLAQEALTEMRALLVTLRPVTLDEEGFAGAIEKLTASFQARTGLAITCRVLTDARPAAEVETAIFRIVEAALDNVLRHSEVREATITLNFAERELVVIVSDAGKGCHLRLVEATAHGGTGLLGMRERARQIGAALHLDSAPGRGMTVRLSVPLLSLMAVGAGTRRRTPNES